MELKARQVYSSLLLVISILVVQAASQHNAKSELADYDESYELDARDAVSDEKLYADKFPYAEEPVEMTNTIGKRRGRAHVQVVRKYVGKPHNYAKKYRTWMPSKELLKPVHRGRPYPKRRGPGMRRNGGRRGSPPRRRKIRPTNVNELRRPTPPPQPDYEDFSKEYFPEETRRRPVYKPRKKKKRPKPVLSDEVEPTISYSNFIQHPSTTDHQDYYDDEYRMPSVMKERKKRKKKKQQQKRKKPLDEDLSGAYTESSEERQKPYDDYPPYNGVRPTQASPTYTEKHPAYPHYQQTDGLGKHHETSPAYPHYQQTDGLGKHHETSPAYNYKQHNIQPQIPQPNYNVINNLNQQAGILPRPTHNYASSHEFSSKYTTNDFTPNYISRQPVRNEIQSYSNPLQPNNNYNRPSTDYVSRQPSNDFTNRFQQANDYSKFGNSQQQSNGFSFGSEHHQTGNDYSQYSQPIEHEQNRYPNGLGNSEPVTKPYVNASPFNTRGNSFFDNTDTFQDFNRNVDLPTPNRSGANNIGEESSFINHHLQLYTNGMSGIPVQGHTRTKDYDIGYGELQYDESHRT